MLKAGDKVPDVAIPDQNGKPISLKDFQGKKIVLYFYPKDQTPGCTAEACNLRDNYKTLLNQGYVVLGVSTDSAKSHQKFIEKEKLPFPLLADEDKKLHDAFGTWVEKSMYGRKYMGTARVTYVVNEDGIVEEVIEKVNTSDHASQILKNESADELKKPGRKSVKSAAAKSETKSPAKKPTLNKYKKTGVKVAKKAAKKSKSKR